MRRLWERWRKRREIGGEIDAYLEEKVADLKDQGLPEDEARRRARREFGNPTHIAEDSRGVLGWDWLEHLMQDLRYATRTLRRSPSFTAVAVLSLTLGIGANVAIFGLLDTIAWKMLPVREPETLWAIAVKENGPKDPAGLSHSYPLYTTWRDHNRTWEGLVAGSSYAWRDRSAASDNTWHEAQLVSGNYFDVLGVPAFLGRVLTPADDLTEGVGGPQGAVVVLSYRYWRHRFRGDAGTIGKALNVNGVWFTIVGVAPPEFFGIQVGTSPDIYIPLQLQPILGPPGNLLHDTPTSTSTWLTVMGRLKPGVSRAQAKDDLSALYEPYWTGRLSPEQRSSHTAGPKSSGRSVTLEPAGRGFSVLRDRYSEPLQILMVLAGIVLLIVCANLANLSLARVNARTKEMAVRLAIGAGRMRLVRQILTESLLLATAGGALGVVFALWSSGILIRMLPQREQIPLVLDLTPGPGLLGFAFTLSLVAGLVFGLAPVIRFAVSQPLIPGGHTTGRAPRFAWNKAVILAEMALALPLIVGAALFIGTLYNLAAVDTGFSRQNVWQLRFSAYSLPRDQWGRAYEQISQRIGSVPGVIAYSLANRGLMQGGGTRSGPLEVPGYQFQAAEARQLREYSVGPGYFSASGIPLRLGRVFDGRDVADSVNVSIVNQEFVRHYLHGQDPIGLRYGIGKPATYYEIVGVVGDAKYNDLREDVIPLAYYPWPQQMPLRLFSIIVRTRGDSTAIAPALRRAVMEVHPDFYTDLRTLSSEIDNTLIRERLLAGLSGFFGFLAVLLACLGLYGVTAFGVTRRTAEIGVRMALGAVSSDVVRLVMRETMLLACAGIALGVPLALWMSRLTSGFLFGLRPADPRVLIAGAAVLLAVCALAGWLPARRAARVDPMAALRWE